MTDRLSKVPQFSIGQSTWQCWITDDGQRYEWRSMCGRHSATREGRYWRAKTNGLDLGEDFHSLKIAMVAALQVRRAA